MYSTHERAGRDDPISEGEEHLKYRDQHTGETSEQAGSQVIE